LARFIPEYVESVIREIKLMSTASEEKLRVHTVYIGGGTPSLMEPSQIQNILNVIRQEFDLIDEAEISMEANPGTVSREKLLVFRKSGINRISYGVQSFQPDELKLLGRIHTAEEAKTAVLLARQAGFENLNLDLIYGLPGQKIEMWKDSLQQVLALQPEHISLYSLTLEDGTCMNHQVQSGKIPAPDDDLAAEMYLMAEITLNEDFCHYEISNWAAKRNGKSLECRHNLQYWLNEPYFGFGAGAHGCMAGFRFANIADIQQYISRIKQAENMQFPFSPANDSRIEIDAATEMNETMMLGLRLTEEGVSRKHFRDRFGKEMEIVYKKSIEKLISQGLICWDDERTRLKLTDRGRLLGNRVFMEFV
jgi:oxygen-independent coproporphyrinogen-3 oxidase